MSIYLHDIPLPEAQERLETALKDAGLWGISGTEVIRLDEAAIGRVTAGPIWAKLSSPHYHASAMDGFAVRAGDTVGAMLNEPITLVCERQGFYVDTGDPLPIWADAVIPIENVEPVDERGQLSGTPRAPNGIRIWASVAPWQHVRPMGEDMVATQLVLPGGHVLRPVDLGAVAACGHEEVTVSRQPSVAILPTGTELVEIGRPVGAGDIIEYNSMVLAANVNLWGGSATRLPIVEDDFIAICREVARAALSNDLVLIIAGSSAGSEDYTAKVVETLGDLYVHGVAVRPGHPVILGMIDLVKATEFLDQFADEAELSREKGNRSFVPVIGVPGYPVSAALTSEIFIEPLLACWLGRTAFKPEKVNAKLTHKITSPAGDDDYMRVAVGKVDNQLLAAPLSRGSGVISSLVRADGIVIVPRGAQGLPAGADIEVRLYRSTRDLANTIFAIGSHDISLDLLAQYLAARGRRLASSNVGSLGGLIALRRGEAHFAGSHLLDPASGVYNTSYIQEYLPGIPVKIIALVERQQGLLVPPGNPKGISSLADLTDPEIVFINRQRGAGTRVLLDYQLGLLGIAPANINGYTQEEYTHLAVAAAIASGRADCGLGIAAAAQALELDFMPLFQEKYELVIPIKFFGQSLLAPLFDILACDKFQHEVSSMPGYSVERMGELVAEIE